MSVGMGWLARTRLQPPQRTAGGVVLRNPKGVLILGVVGAVPFLALAIASFLSLLRGSGVGVGMGFLAFSSLGGIMILNYYREFSEINANGIRYRRVFGSSGRANWREVSKVHYSERLKWFRLDLKTGGCVRVSALMVGLPEFARLVLEACTDAEIDEKTRSILVSTVSGTLPIVW